MGERHGCPLPVKGGSQLLPEKATIFLFREDNKATMQRVRASRPWCPNYVATMNIAIMQSATTNFGPENQSWARDNSVATMGPCFQGTKLFVFVILLFLLWLPHLDTEA